MVCLDGGRTATHCNFEQAFIVLQAAKSNSPTTISSTRMDWMAEEKTCSVRVVTASVCLVGSVDQVENVDTQHLRSAIMRVAFAMQMTSLIASVRFHSSHL